MTRGSVLRNRSTPDETGTSSGQSGRIDAVPASRPAGHRESLFVLLFRVHGFSFRVEPTPVATEGWVGRTRWHEGVVGGEGIRRSTSPDLARRMRPDLPVRDVMTPHLRLRPSRSCSRRARGRRAPRRRCPVPRPRPWSVSVGLSSGTLIDSLGGPTGSASTFGAPSRSWRRRGPGRPGDAEC